MSDEINIEGLGDEIERMMKDAIGSSAYSWERKRPFNGQPQTCHGERGKTLVEGLTFRDVMDCFISGLLHCCGVDQPDLYAIADKAVHDRMYEVDLSRIDPGAWWQNMACQMEKMMGIYPNVPKLTWSDETSDD